MCNNRLTIYDKLYWFVTKILLYWSISPCKCTITQQSTV